MDDHANAEYNDPGASGPPPIPDPGTGGASGGTVVGAQNDKPGVPAPGREPDRVAITEDYESHKNEDLEGEIRARNLEVPTEGSGQGGKVVKADLVEVLEEDDTDDGPDADKR